MLVSQIVTGVFLAMYYTPNAALAFQSVEHIMRDVNYGWLLRYLHANGASMFFVAVYIHIFRGLYYGSYKAPREILWILGVIIYLLMMATAFMGYVLPWGQMSFWGATVITNILAAIPVIGDTIAEPALGRLFGRQPDPQPLLLDLHYLLPFMIVGVVDPARLGAARAGPEQPDGRSDQVRQGCGAVHALRDDQGHLRHRRVPDLLRLFRLLHPELSGPCGQLRSGQPVGDAVAHRAGMVLPAVLRHPARHSRQARRRHRHVRVDRRSGLRALARHLPRALDGLPARSTSSSSGSSWRSRSCSAGSARSRPRAGTSSSRRSRRPTTSSTSWSILPVLGFVERPLPLPNSILESVMGGQKAGSGIPAGANAEPQSKRLMRAPEN